jgi:hypothetical protein
VPLAHDASPRFRWTLAALVLLVLFGPAALPAQRTAPTARPSPAGSPACAPGRTHLILIPNPQKQLTNNGTADSHGGNRGNGGQLYLCSLCSLRVRSFLFRIWFSPFIPSTLTHALEAEKAAKSIRYPSLFLCCSSASSERPYAGRRSSARPRNMNHTGSNGVNGRLAIR